MSRIHDALKRAETDQALLRPKPDDADVQGVLRHTTNTAVDTTTSLGESAVASDPILPSTTVQLSRDEIELLPQGKWRPESDMLFLSNNEDNGWGMEEFRTLRSRLYRLRDRKALRTIMVGSALPGEGKTFVAANLAQVLARQLGKRALLIDCDLRKASLHEHLGTNAMPGLADYLRGKADQISIIQRGPMDNLYFIPAGTEVENPAELLGNGRLNALVGAAAPIFDWIVIDTPPVVPVADATLVAPVCDGVLLVVLAASSPWDMAKKARQEFRQFPMLGAVLNQIKTRTGYSRYYKDPSGKRRSYGYGYGNRKPG